MVGMENVKKRHRYVAGFSSELRSPLMNTDDTDGSLVIEKSWKLYRESTRMSADQQTSAENSHVSTLAERRSGGLTPEFLKDSGGVDKVLDAQ